MRYTFIIALAIIVILSGCSNKNSVKDSPKERQAREFFAYCQRDIARSADVAIKEKLKANALRRTIEKFEGTAFADSCRIALLPLCNDVELTDMLGDVPANAKKYAEDILKRKHSEEIARSGTRYFDMEGVLECGGKTKPITLQSLIGKDGKSVVLFFCDIRNVGTGHLIQQLDNCKNLKQCNEIIMVPIDNTMKDIKAFRLRSKESFPLFLENGHQVVSKYGYGIYTLPAVVVINTHGTIVERYKNEWNVKQRLLTL